MPFEGRDGSQRISQRLQKQLNSIVAADMFDERQVRSRTNHFAWGVAEAKCILVTAVCVSVPRRIPTLLHGPGCKLGNGRGCPLVVYYWVDFQSVHGFRCYDNIAPNAKCQRVLVLALCLLRNLHPEHSIGLCVDT